MNDGRADRIYRKRIYTLSTYRAYPEKFWTLINVNKGYLGGLRIFKKNCEAQSLIN